MTLALKTLAPALVLAALATASPASAQEAVQISIKEHRFNPAEIKLPAGKAVTLQVRNLDSTPEEFESKTLKIEKVIPGNSSATIQLRPLQPGRYKFFGEFNEKTAQGVFVVE
jgi:plastocyanin